MIVIPLGGIGSRFKKNGYREPKGLIKVKDKEIIFYLLDNLKNLEKETIYITYNKEYKGFELENILNNRYTDYNFSFLCLEENTRGAAETLYITIKNIEKEEPVLCIDADNFYNTDIVKLWGKKNNIFVFNDKKNEPIYSYIKNKDNFLIDIKEKEKISNLACCGAYGFSSLKELKKYCQLVIENDIRDKEEFYLSTVIKEMLKNGIKFNFTEIYNKDYFTLGTPKNVKIFEKTLLFDLDGTLVYTDEIYLKVWKKILSDYDLNINIEFFNTFIKGVSDCFFLKNLIPSLNEVKIKEISQRKDEIFCSLINEKDILLPGVLDFLEKNKNSTISIVTSCNHKAAIKIIEMTKIKQYINLLISSEDVKEHKPSPYPYNLAMKTLNSDPEKTFIFEDSYSGYISAKNSKAKNIILIQNKYSPDEIRKVEEFKICDFKNLNIDFDCKNNSSKIKEEEICKILDLPVKKIVQHEDNLKTGYICDIKKFTVYYNDNKLEIILKISNLENELSKTALKLNMYEKESYFYEKLSYKLNDCINLPKYFGSMIEGNKEGVILENLNIYNGTFNIDLNKNISILLKVIKNIFNMHSTFYFQKESDLTNDMKTLKKINQIDYYYQLIQDRFDKFIKLNRVFMEEKVVKIFKNIYDNFENICNESSDYPLSFCHGDLKSPNIFYKDSIEPYFLDWQYIHLNKGVSDIVFLLIESIVFDKNIISIVEKYYYQLLKEKNMVNDYQTYLNDFKNSLRIFPFFVCVWFNSEDRDKLIDKTFPIRFMKNLIKYYEYYL